MKETANLILANDENNIEALRIYGKACFELGKEEDNSCQLIQVGIEKLQKALELSENSDKEVRPEYQDTLLRELRLA